VRSRWNYATFYGTGYTIGFLRGPQAVVVVEVALMRKFTKASCKQIIIIMIETQKVI
jgi:hypothetical protein